MVQKLMLVVETELATCSYPVFGLAYLLKLLEPVVLQLLCAAMMLAAYYLEAGKTVLAGGIMTAADGHCCLFECLSHVNDGLTWGHVQ